MALADPLAADDFFDLFDVEECQFVQRFNQQRTMEGGGDVNYADRAPSLWQAECTSIPLTLANSEGLMALINSRRGGIKTVLMYNRRLPYPVDDPDGSKIAAGSVIPIGGTAVSGDFGADEFTFEGLDVSQGTVLSCTRASARNPIINGTVYSFAANEPCIAEGVLALPEPESTNILTHSRDFSNASWVKTRIDVADSAEISAIDGEIVKSVTRNSTTESAFLLKGISGSIGTTKTATFRVKAKSEGGYYGSRLQGAYPDRVDAVINISDGSIAYSTPSGSQNYTGTVTTPLLDSEGFWVWSLTVTAVNSAFQSIVHGPTDAPHASGSWESITPVLCDAYVDNVQLEDRADATSPMISGATPFIREAETIDFHATGTNNWTFNTDGGAETINGEVGDLEIAAGDLTGTEASVFDAERVTQPGAASPEIATITDRQNISFSGFPPGYVLARGTYFGCVFDTSRRFLGQVVEDAEADTNGDVSTVAIWPPLPASVVTETAVSVSQPPAKFIINPGSAYPALVNPIYSRIQFSAEQTYRK